ncbi:MAG: F0F1 ATP synthase subunit delta [Actinomycetota bacterium]
MNGSSRDAVAKARAALDSVMDSSAGAEEQRAIGEQLFAVVGLLDEHSALRRALTDPSHDGQEKADVVSGLLGERISGPASRVIHAAVQGRWSQTRDLADALEDFAVTAVVASAERAGTADRLEEELFRFERTIAGDAQLAAALGDSQATPGRRSALVDELITGKALPVTCLLIRRVVSAPRGRSLTDSLTHYARLAATRREQLIALVTVAGPLVASHRDRLAAVLAQMYGKKIQLNVAVDPQVLGGIRIDIDDEVIDGSIVRRLADVRRRLAG